jgi:hypothetical protein
VATAAGEVQDSLDRALLWHGSAASVVDLTPFPIKSGRDARALGTDGTHEVGTVQVVSGIFQYFHASLWSGTAASWVDLHPASGFDSSVARAVAGNQEVGSGATSLSSSRALMWSGSAASVVDLTPDQFGISVAGALGTNGVNQVGYGEVYDPTHFTNEDRALLWSGTTASAVNLHDLLPPGFYASRAYSIDDTGTIWGLATSSSDGLTHVVKWTAVPEPSTLMSIASLFIFGAARRRHSMPLQASI